MKTGKKSSSKKETALSMILSQQPVPFGIKSRSHSETKRNMSSDTSAFREASRDPYLQHVMKQINFLKVENLELKKMISD